MRISDWSSDVCSSDLDDVGKLHLAGEDARDAELPQRVVIVTGDRAADEHRDIRAAQVGERIARLPHEFDVAARKDAEADRVDILVHRDPGDEIGRLAQDGIEDRKSVVSGKSVSVRVTLGGPRIIKK